MALKTGLAAQMTSPVTESTYGVAPSLSGAKFTAFKSETLASAKTTVQGIGILSGKLYPQTGRRVLTNFTAGGAVMMDCPAQGLQQWLYPMFGSYGQTPAALTEDASTGAYKAVHAPGALEGNSFCIQKGVPAVDNGTVEPFTYVGCKITEWELSTQVGQIAELSITIDARNELGGTGNSDPLNGSIPALQAYSAPANAEIPNVFHFRQATLYTGGTPSTTSGVTTLGSPTTASNVLTCSIKHTVPLDVSRFFLGSNGFKSEQLQNNLRAISGTFTAEFASSESFYDAYAADTATAMQLSFVGAGIGSGSDLQTLSILVPNIRLDGEPPKVAGLGPVQLTVPWTGLDNGTDNVIQATYWTLDSA